MTLVVRPAATADLDALMRLAANAVPQLTNLPAHRERLGARLEQSAADLAGTVESPSAEYYVFVLEDRGDDGSQVVGTASVRARTGAREAYYTWRREMLIHASQQLDVRREVSILSLSHELSASSLLCAYSLDPRYRGGNGERLLRRARLLFAAQHPERFTPLIAVAMPGRLNTDNSSPFWESVGRHFFARDFHEINEMAGIHSKSFIAEVMPPFPLYEPLLTDTARAAIGSIHDAHHAAAADFVDEGFEPSRHVDLFDGGQLLEARFGRLHCVRHNRWHPVRVCDPFDSSVDSSMDNRGGTAALVANQRTADFRCALVAYALGATDRLVLDTDAATALDLNPDEAVLAVELKQAAGANPC